MSEERDRMIAHHDVLRAKEQAGFYGVLGAAAGFAAFASFLACLGTLALEAYARWHRADLPRRTRDRKMKLRRLIAGGIASIAVLVGPAQGQ